MYILIFCLCNPIDQTAQTGKAVEINGNGHDEKHDAQDDDHGKPVQIVLSESDHDFRLNEKALEDILTQNNIKDKKVVVISVAGAYRKGKSFLLDFFLRYLERNVSLNIYVMAQYITT